MKKKYDKIKNKMMRLYKKPEKIAYQDLLAELELSEAEYIFAIRSS